LTTLAGADAQIADFAILRWMANQAERRMTDDRWLSVEEIAEHLGVTKDSVYRWIEKRGLPAHKVGKLWKFKKDEVDAWVRSGQGAEDDERENA
jgi:excisionase family DNA binding protein